MKLYFEEPRHRELLRQQVDEWIGVPYEHMGETKSGIDCTKLLGKMLMGIGVFNGNLPNIYAPQDWMISGKQEVLLNFTDETFKKHLNRGLYCSKLTGQIERQIGDILFFSNMKSGVCNHSALYIGDNNIFHCLTYRSCLIEKLSVAWARRIKKVYRVMIWP